MSYNDDKYWEDKYESLLYDYKEIQRKYNDLDSKFHKTYNDLDSAQFKIKTELEPRIKSEERAYDLSVSDGGYDKWMSNVVDEYACNSDQIWWLDIERMKWCGELMNQLFDKGFSKEDLLKLF